MKSIFAILKTFKVKVKKIFWVLGLHAFWLILLFVFIDLMFGSFIFYKYVFSAEGDEGSVTGTIIEFNERSYKNILEELHARELSGIELPVQPVPGNMAPD